MWAAIVTFVGNLFALALEVMKRFPPKPTQTKIEEGHQDLDEEQRKVKKEGRPQW